MMSSNNNSIAKVNGQLANQSNMQPKFASQYAAQSR